MSDKIEQIIAENTLAVVGNGGKQVAEQINAYRYELQLGEPSFQRVKSVLLYLLSYASTNNGARENIPEFEIKELAQVAKEAESILGQLVPIVDYKPGGNFVAKHPDFPDLEGFGGTYSEAVQDFYDNLAAAQGGSEQP